MDHLKDIVDYYDRRGACVYFVGLVPMRLRPRGELPANVYRRREDKVNKHMYRFMGHVRQNSFINLPAICRRPLLYKPEGCHLRDPVRDTVAAAIADHILHDLSQ